MEGSENIDTSNMSDQKKRQSRNSHENIKMSSAMRKEIAMEIEEASDDNSNQQIHAQKPLEVIDLSQEQDMEEEKIDTGNGGRHQNLTLS